MSLRKYESFSPNLDKLDISLGVEESASEGPYVVRPTSDFGTYSLNIKAGRDPLVLLNMMIEVASGEDMKLPEIKRKMRDREDWSVKRTEKALKEALDERLVQGTTKRGQRYITDFQKHIDRTYKERAIESGATFPHEFDVKELKEGRN